MKTEEIIDRLRNPQKYNKAVPTQETVPTTTQQTSPAAATASSATTLLALVIAAGVLVAAGIVTLVMLSAKNRAEDISAALKPEDVQGLSTQTDFNPFRDATYVQIQEGQDRNVAVDELGTTLPVITRFNYQAITPKNYGIIGLAPWALTENFSSNLTDPELIRYLLNRPEVGEAFISRSDVAPVLEDPQLLAAFAQDNAKLDEFFNSEVVQKVLANPDMVRKVGGSRFVSYLLVSKAVKHFRDHPAEAVQLIQSSPALSALRQNEGIRQAVTENYYLKNIASQLLGPAETRAVYAPATKK